MRMLLPALVCWLLAWSSLHGDDIDRTYPLGPQLRVLAQDVDSPTYREWVLKKMLATDLAAEWQREATEDNAEAFLAQHGGKEKVLADAALKRAYERRLQIRERFRDLMRQGFKRHNAAAPFDRGQQAEPAGTLTKVPAGPKVAISAVLPAADAGKFWPRFRGPSGQGLTGLKSLPVTWSKDSDNIVWRVRVPGQGNSSPITWADRIFLTSAGEGGKDRFVHCLNKEDGKLLWSRRVPERPTETGVRDKNGYASATPVTDGERVIAFLGTCGLVCYDFKGNLKWQYDDFRVATTHGTGSSPVLYKDSVILVQDQNRAASIFLAVDKRTGKLLWKQSRDRAMTWSTPVVLRVGTRDELIFAGAEHVKGYDPNTGRELWALKGPTYEVVPAVVFGEGLIYSASGRNGPTLALRPGRGTRASGSGDVTETHLAWRAVRGGPHVPAPIYLDGRLYTVNDFGIATCLDAATGRLMWQERLADRFSASPIEAGGLLYFPAESGVTYVLRAAERFEVVAQNDLGSPILASPAVVDGKLLLRTQEELVCIGPKQKR
ncbi:MAG: PQQ-like beta-propeller repeat protein [Planctomycetes bacterium]|nr:PQQ-like beta-propeller repeat protein [Planctomycetota bacterium]